MPGCFHVGCTSGYGFGPTCRESYTKCHLFKLPKQATESIRQTWIRNIPKQLNRSFDYQKHLLCNLHFEDKYIIKDKFITYSEGEVPVRVGERKNWTLTASAIPTIFKNCKVSALYNKSIRERKRPRDRSAGPINKKGSYITTRPEEPEKNVGGHVEEETTHNTYNVFHDLENIIIPRGWTLQINENIEVPSILLIQLLDVTNNFISAYIAKCIRIIKTSTDVHAEVFFNGKTIQTVSINSLDEIQELLGSTIAMQRCEGVQKYSHLTDCKSGVLRNDTWYSKTCGGTTVSPTNLCSSCTKMFSTMKRAQSRLNRRNKDEVTRSRNTSDAKENVKSIKKKLQNTKQQLFKKQLNSAKDRIALALLRRRILSSTENNLLQNIDASDIPDNMKMSLKTALCNAKRKSAKGNRYESGWLLQCMLLKIKSPQAYRHLRNNKLLPLPHPTSLHKLIRGIPCEFGFNDFVFDELRKEYSGKTIPEREVVLMFDEIKVREEISFNKLRFEFNGFVNYGAEHDGTTDMADHALVFMFRSQYSKTIQPLGSFATRGAAPGDILAKLLLSCVIRLEDCGVRVSGVISDGATTNKQMWKHFGVSGSHGNVQNKIIHPCEENVDGRPSRYLFFFTDVPHIIKCIRNHFFKYRCLKFKGQDINSGFYQAVFDLDNTLNPGLRVAPKLTSSHINPTSFQKMRVCLATQIFSKSVANAIKFYREQGHSVLKYSEHTEHFTTEINELFDALNARYPTVGVKPNSIQYEKIKEFVYLLNSGESLNTFASTVTLQSLRVTLQSFLDIIDYWNSIGFHYVLTGKVNQDCLERFFGILRQAAGDEDHPTVISFMHLYRLLCIYTPTAKLVRANVSVSDESSLALANYAELLLKNSKRRTVAGIEMRKPVEDKILQRIVAEEQDPGFVTDDHDYCRTESNSCVVYQLCGYLAHKSSKSGLFTKCDDCINTLFTYESPNQSEASLTSLKSLGFLKYPSKALYQMILSVEPKIADKLKSKIHCEIVEEIVENILRVNSFGIGCSKQDHSEKLTVRLVSFYITIRMFFFVKVYNREIVRSRNITKKQRKMSKLN